MADIQFDEEQGFVRPAAVLPQQSTFVRFVLNTGIVKTEREAEYILLGSAIVGIIFTIYMLFPSGNEQRPIPSITGELIEQTP